MIAKSIPWIFFTIFFFLQSLPTLFGFFLWFLWVRLATLKGRYLFLLGNLAIIPFLIEDHFEFFQKGFFPSFKLLIIERVRINQIFWHCLFQTHDFFKAMHVWYEGNALYFSLTVLWIGGILGVFDKSPRPYVLRKKSRKEEFSPGEIQGGIFLGNSFIGKQIIMKDDMVNQGVLVLGTTGGGKSITLRRFYERALLKGNPLIIIDGKPTEDTLTWLKKKSAETERPFYGFNCEEGWHYNPLHTGSFTELKDKIMSLKDSWESDYYRSVAEDYLQTVCAVLKFSEKNFDLEKIISLLDYGDLVLYVRHLKGEPAFLKPLQERVKKLSQYKHEDIKGLQAHLNLLVHSELGEFLKQNEEHTFSLMDVLDQKGVAYFALPSLRYPYFSKTLGKLIINDIKTILDRQKGTQRIFILFDEFSVFAGEQVLNLVTMGRGKGAHVILGTQGLSDLKKVHPTFANQILNCVNTIICHRLNDQESAEAISHWGGQEEKWSYTHHLSDDEKEPRRGSLKKELQWALTADMIKKRS